MSKATIDAMNWLRDQMIAEDVVGTSELVLAEALNNIIEHAYEFKETAEISVAAQIDDQSICFRLTDWGKKFPGIPQKKEMKGNEVAFDDLPEGGFGWFLIHELTTKISYLRDADSNLLFLFIDKNANSSSAA